MPKEYSHDHGVTVHRGPLAGTTGDNWEKDAVELERRNQEMIENPNKTFPNNMTTIDKAHAHRSKSDEGQVSATEDGLTGTRERRGD